MRIKRFSFMLIIMIAVLIGKPSFAAEEVKKTDHLILTNITKTHDINPDDASGIESRWNSSSNSYSQEPPQKSGIFDLPIDLPIPLEIDSLEPNLIDPSIRSGLDPKWRKKNLSCTFGIKYSFSRFEFQHFAKSLASFFGNLNKGVSNKGRKGNLPVSFYLSFPDF